MAEPIALYGSIVSAPQARYDDRGKLVVHFRMVQDDRYNANRTGTGAPDYQDRKPGLFLDVDAWEQEWLLESDIKPGERVSVRGLLRQEKDYPHPEFDKIKAATGIEVMVKGGVKMLAREVLVSTARRIISTRNPYKDGTASARRGQNGQQAPQQAPASQGGQQAPQQDPWAQQQGAATASPQQAPAPQGGQQAPQQDPWAQQVSQAPQGDPWAQNG